MNFSEIEFLEWEECVCMAVDWVLIEPRGVCSSQETHPRKSAETKKTIIIETSERLAAHGSDLLVSGIVVIACMAMFKTAAVSKNNHDNNE